MIKTAKHREKILVMLLKDMGIKKTVSSIAHEIGLSRVGAWKILKKMEAEGIIAISRVGAGDTSALFIELNWVCPILEKTLSLALMEDAIRNPRWMDTFKELQPKADFLLLYGSAISSPREANDIDILCISGGRQKILEIDRIISKIQKTQLRKIHALCLTPRELASELSKPNMPYVDALKKGIVLFGQDEFVAFMRGVWRHGR